MSTAGEVPAFFQRMGSESPARPRQKFCGVFCPVEGSSDSKTLDFDALSACRGRSDGRVIDRQTDISQPRKVEIRESTGKEALQNLDDKRVIFSDFACRLCIFYTSLSQSSSFCLCFSTFIIPALIYFIQHSAFCTHPRHFSSTIASVTEPLPLSRVCLSIHIQFMPDNLP